MVSLKFNRIFLLSIKAKNQQKLSLEENQHLDNCLRDREFISNYIELMINMHNQIVNKLYMILNTNTIRFHSNSNNGKKKSRSNLDHQSSKKTDRHLFRSFRILGE